MRFGIAPRLALVLAVFAVLASGLTGYYAYQSSRRMLVERAEQSLLASAQVMGWRLTDSLNDAARDALLLAELARPMRNDDADLRRSAAALMHVHPEYFQVRLIDGRQYGLEKIRLDRDGQGIAAVDGSALQEKGHHLYVSNTLQLAPGQVYLSRVFINKENGAHAGFERPTLVVATPVAGADDAVGSGRLVVINLDLETLFEAMPRESSANFKLYLTNEAGDFLVHPDAAQTFGFERGRRILAQTRFPAVADIVAGRRDDVLVKGVPSSGAPLVAAFHKIALPGFSTPGFFVLGLSEPLETVLRDTRFLAGDIGRIVLGFSLFALLLAWLVAGAVSRPLKRILRSLRQFAASGEADNGSLPLKRRNEIGALARGVVDMQARIRSQIATLKASHAAMAYLAHHDPLTGLPNRATFLELLKQAIAQAERQSHRLAVLFVDLDHFKTINDRYGHQVGDRLLQAVARRLQSGVRESDTVARLAGDEFVLLLNPVRTAEEAGRVAEKLLERLCLPLQLEDCQIEASASIGVSVYPENGVTPQALLETADAAMYASKRAGRNAARLAGAEAPA
jgi:diguanylate cyclase (GGDEF)-like protein